MLVKGRPELNMEAWETWEVEMIIREYWVYPLWISNKMMSQNIFPIFETIILLLLFNIKFIPFIPFNLLMSMNYSPTHNNNYNNDIIYFFLCYFYR